MRNIILLLVLSFVTAPAFAIEAGDYNLNGGVGYAGTRGLAGFSLDAFMTENHAVAAAVGVDFVGATATLGYRYFGEKIPRAGSVWSRCFFVFDCDTYIYAGPSLQYANETKIKFTESSGDVREYETASKILGIAALGFRSQFTNRMTFDVEVSYRGILSGGAAKQVSGAVKNDQDSLETGYRTVGLGVALGYLF